MELVNFYFVDYKTFFLSFQWHKASSDIIIEKNILLPITIVNIMNWFVNNNTTITPNSKVINLSLSKLPYRGSAVLRKAKSHKKNVVFHHNDIKQT